MFASYSARRLVLTLCVTACSTQAFAQANRIVSVNSDGNPANNNSYYSAISADGRFVAFQSEASNLVSNDFNGQYDIFVRDMRTGQTTLVSVSTSGSSANSLSLQPSISGNGRYVLFESNASNLVSGDTNGTWDLFMRDLQTQTTIRFSLDSNGNQVFNRSDSPNFAADNRYIIFHSDAALVPEDTNGFTDIYRYDVQSRAVIRVSTTSSGAQANGTSYHPWISADGNMVAFMSSATNLVANDTNNQADVFTKNIGTGEVRRVNVSTQGTQCNDETVWPSISGNGRIVSFCSRGSTLVTGDTNNNWDAFVHDLQTSTTTRINVRPDGSQADSYTRSPTTMTRDGRYVTFASLSTNLVPNDTNGFQDIFVRDLQTNTTIRTSFAYNGGQCGDDCFVPFIAADGRYITFTSEANDHTPGNNYAGRDIFWQDLDAAILLDQQPLRRGERTEFHAYAANPGETVYFLYSTSGVGGGPCPPQLGGLCLDIRNAVQILGSARADNSGHAMINPRLPANAPLIEVHTQAAVRRGNNGVDSVKSNTLSDTIRP